MIRHCLALGAAALVVACAPAGPAPVKKGDLVLSGMQVRASLGVNPHTAGYLTIESKGGPDALVGATCACAERVEIHMMRHEGGVMRMDPIPALGIPAYTRVALEPNGEAHLMLMGLKAPLKAGETVDMTLTFQTAGEVTASFPVVALSDAGH